MRHGRRWRADIVGPGAAVAALASPRRRLRRAAVAGLLVAAALAVSACRSRVPAPGEPTESFAAFLDAEVPRLLRRTGVPGASLALVRQGALAWTGAYGTADVASRRPMTADAVCRAESISKSVTAWGVLRLAEQGAVDLDAPVEALLGGRRLPPSRFPSEQVTVRRLLSANAGMPLGPIGPATEYPPGAPMPTLREYLEGEARIERPPGGGFQYSNVGYNLIELLVEQVTGRDFEEYMSAEVLRPLGMGSARYGWEERFATAVATGYDLAGRSVPPYVYPANASGGLMATAADIGRFVAAGATGSSSPGRAVLSDEAVARVHLGEVPIRGLFGAVAESYGFGHFVETLSDGRKAVWHGGQGHGWMTHFHLVPDSGLGIVILTNSQRSWPLIAELLVAWSRWNGLGPVKFGRIAALSAAMRVAVVALALGAASLGVALARDLRRGARRFAPTSRRSLPARAALAAIASGLLAALAWAASRPYLFVSSLFPGTSSWAAAAAAATAVLLILQALCPRAAGDGCSGRRTVTSRPRTIETPISRRAGPRRGESDGRAK